jgi:S1-C subfamily serine protease
MKKIWHLLIGIFLGFTVGHFFYYHSNKNYGLREAQRSYYPLMTSNGAVGSGVRLNSKLVITCAHLIDDNAIVFDYLGFHKLRLVGIDRENDLALLKINTPYDDYSEIKIGLAKIGDKVFSVSNMSGFSGSVGEFTIRYSGRQIVILDKMVYRGESGSGIFNKNGKLVGIVFGWNQGKGVALNYLKIESFLQKVALYDDDVKKYYQSVTEDFFDKLFWRFF